MFGWIAKGDVDNMAIIPSGSLLIIETDEYSDKTWEGPFRVLKDLDQAVVSQAFRNQSFGQPHGALASDFLPWLVKNGYVEDETNCFAWHVGTYGFDPSNFE